MKKIMVYTAIIGNYDNINEVKYVEKNVDYYCFTDNPNIKSNTWKVIVIDNKDHLDNTRLNRKIKILGDEELEKNYDLVIYVDGNVEFKQPISEFIKNECDLKNYDYFSLIHPDRDCIYEEAIVCKEMNKDSAKDIDKTISFLEQEKFPKHFGLTANTFFMRKTNNTEIKKIQKAWWKMVKNYSKRDQLSFMYCIWKYKYNKIQYLNLLWHNNQYYFIHSHNKSNAKIIEDLQSKVDSLETNIVNIQKSYELKLKEKDKLIEDLKVENNNLKVEYDKILNSKRWKFISKLSNLRK